MFNPWENVGTPGNNVPPLGIIPNLWEYCPILGNIVPPLGSTTHPWEYCPTPGNYAPSVEILSHSEYCPTPGIVDLPVFPRVQRLHLRGDLGHLIFEGLQGKGNHTLVKRIWLTLSLKTLSTDRVYQKYS